MSVVSVLIMGQPRPLAREYPETSGGKCSATAVTVPKNHRTLILDFGRVINLT